jgi:sec-independent protein translocase protein TatA
LVLKEEFMPNIGVPELIIIFVVVFLLFGAKRIPEIGASIGKGIKEFKKTMKDVMEDDNNNKKEEDNKTKDRKT